MALVESHRSDGRHGSAPTLAQNDTWRALYAEATVEGLAACGVDDEQAAAYRLQAAEMYFGKSRISAIPLNALADKLPRGVVVRQGRDLLEVLGGQEGLDSRESEALETARATLAQETEHRYSSRLALEFTSELARVPFTDERAVGYLTAIHRMEPAETQGNVCYIAERLAEAGRPDLAARVAQAVLSYKGAENGTDAARMIGTILKHVAETKVPEMTTPAPPGMPSRSS